MESSISFSAQSRDRSTIRARNCWRVIYIVTLMQVTPDDHQKPYRLKTEIVDPTGNVALFADGEVSVDAHRGENRFWVIKIGLAAPHGGRITFLQSIGGGEPIAIPVELRVE